MRTEVMDFNKTQKKDMINFRAGDVVRVYRKIKEGEKERIQIFEGMIISIKGGQSSSPMITVRKVSNGVGIEIIVPAFSPAIEKIELVKRAKVRQSKLYYVRDKAAKALRFKFTDKSEIIEDVAEAKTLVEDVATKSEEVVDETKKDSSEK
jgi:large subunit ribosomal protein L19